MESKSNYGIIAVIMLFWFVISFVTNIIGPLIPDIIDNFSLSNLAMASFIPTSFFIAYGIMSIPAGIMADKLSAKTLFMMGFALPFFGSILFVANPTFPMLCASSFIIGLGMAMLQTIINPTKRKVGGEENFAFYSVMGQLVFGAASFVSPFVYTFLVTNLQSGEQHSGLLGLIQSVTPSELPWVSLYWLFAAVLLAMIVVSALVPFPKTELKEDEKSGSAASYKELLHNKYTYLFFLAMICYTSTEQGVANWISEFLKQYHEVDAQTQGAAVVGRFWGFMSIGCVAGLGALKLWDSKAILKVAASASIIALYFALWGSTQVAIWAFPVVGFSISVLFSIIMSLALNSVSAHHGSLAGIICSAIMGGAIGPLVVGGVATLFDLRVAMMVITLPLLYILSVGFWAKPLVNNKTISRD